MFIFSFSCVKNELLPSHPLELSEKNVSMLPVFLFLPSGRKMMLVIPDKNNSGVEHLTIKNMKPCFQYPME